MRIALMPSRFAPFVGGVEELSRNLAGALVGAGDEVEVWTSNPDGTGTIGPMVLDGLRVRRFDFALPAMSARSIASCSRKAPATMRALFAAERSFRPDLVHVQCFGPNGPYATALSALRGLPLIVSLQGETVMDDQDIFEKSITLRTSLRLGLRRARKVTACSSLPSMTE